MHTLINTCTQHPEDEMLDLLRFAMKHTPVDYSHVGVIIQDTPKPYKGHAWGFIPARSVFRDSRGATDLWGQMMISVGAPHHFPRKNAWNHGKWRRLRKGENALDFAHRRHGWTRSSGHYTEVWAVEYHAYGGLNSPIIEYKNWRECFVAVAAHECRHLQQYQAGRRDGKNVMPHSEVDCERHALRVLELYREACRAVPTPLRPETQPLARAAVTPAPTAVHAPYLNGRRQG